VSKNVTQAFIVVFSCITVLLFSSRELYALGFLTGIIGQPFWMYSAYKDKAWGIFAVSVWFTIMYIKGMVNFW